MADGQGQWWGCTREREAEEAGGAGAHRPGLRPGAAQWGGATGSQTQCEGARAEPAWDGAPATPRQAASPLTPGAALPRPGVRPALLTQTLAGGPLGLEALEEREGGIREAGAVSSRNGFSARSRPLLPGRGSRVSPPPPPGP